MATSQFFTRTQDAPVYPWGSYDAKPTHHGIRFQISVRNPSNNLLLAALIAFSIALALLTYASFWSFIGAVLLLLMLIWIPYLSFQRTRLCWIEIRPDGVSITRDISKPEQQQFFYRRDLSNWQLDFDLGLSFRCGIYDILATPAFSDRREFEIFELHINSVRARMWHQQNLQS